LVVVVGGCGDERSKRKVVEGDEEVNAVVPTGIASDILLSWWREGFSEFVNLILNGRGGQGEGWIARER
jgi:hypothetical protein